MPGLDKVYGVGRGNLFYEPADSDLPSEHDWSTEKYLRHAPKLFERIRENSASNTICCTTCIIA